MHMLEPDKASKFRQWIKHNSNLMNGQWNLTQNYVFEFLVNCTKLCVNKCEKQKHWTVDLAIVCECSILNSVCLRIHNADHEIIPE